MSVEGTLQELRNDLAAVAEGVQANEKSLHRLDGRVGHLETRVGHLETDFRGLRSEQTAGFTEVLAVLHQVREHTEGIPSLGEKLRKLREAIDFLGRKALQPEDYEKLRQAIAGL